MYKGSEALPADTKPRTVHPVDHLERRGIERGNAMTYKERMRKGCNWNCFNGNIGKREKTKQQPTLETGWSAFMGFP